ncbi:hypothetical protein, partial [Klebsiella aerogenes]|uniref:hypothetical protein n=1 Tax=Klebsiella aerogenes TaxID=548 RepID=UPI001CC4DC62
MVSFVERSFDKALARRSMLREQHDTAAPPRNNAAAEQDYLDVLNAGQRRAVEHDCEAPVSDRRALLIIAGAGS